MQRIFRAFLHSVDGLAFGLRREAALRQEIAVLVAGVPLAILISGGAWRAVTLIAVLLVVLMVECVNIAIERLADHVTPHRHPEIKAVKDLGSAAVLVALVLAGAVWAVALAERVGLA